MAIYQDTRSFTSRVRWLRALFLLCFLALFAKLWHLMILESMHYQELAERNQLRTIPLIAPRGLIRDREGRVLVDNTRSFSLGLFREEGQNIDRILEFLAAGLHLDPEALRSRLKKAHHYAPYQPVILSENISIRDVSYVLSHQAEHPELRIIEQPRRIYRYKRLAAHALGYVGEVSESELEMREFSEHRPGDIIGKFGLERSYNRLLTGRDGQQAILVNSRGETIQTLDRLEPVVGKGLTLSLDLDLQMVAERALAADHGAVVALNPQTGEILAMASQPAFDPNDFAIRISHQHWENLKGDPDSPFQNRSTQSTFSPGSIFKLIIALAALEKGVGDSTTSVYCRGAAVLHGALFRCWKAGGHGRVSLHEAIQHSCNVFFYQLAQKLGIDEISAYGRKFGFGQLTGIDLPGEAWGLVPSREWKRKRTGEPWYPGETISVAIGQGPITVTPIQLARFIGLLATGQAPPLNLIQGSKPVHRPEAPPLPVPVISEENLKTIREAMWSVVNEWGTGKAARVPGFEVCGKTGTAQTISQAARAGLSEEEAERFQHNAWFVGFAPHDNPKIVVVVIVQRGGAGGSAAAPIARQILKRFYEKHKRPPPKTIEVALNGKQLAAGGVENV